MALGGGAPAGSACVSPAPPHCCASVSPLTKVGGGGGGGRSLPQHPPTQFSFPLSAGCWESPDPPRPPPLHPPKGALEGGAPTHRGGAAAVSGTPTAARSAPITSPHGAGSRHRRRGGRIRGGVSLPPPRPAPMGAKSCPAPPSPPPLPTSTITFTSLSPRGVTRFPPRRVGGALSHGCLCPTAGRVWGGAGPPPGGGGGVGAN